MSIKVKDNTVTFKRIIRNCEDCIDYLSLEYGNNRIHICIFDGENIHLLVRRLKSSLSGHCIPDWCPRLDKPEEGD